MGLKGILEKMKLVESDEPVVEASAPLPKAVAAAAAPVAAPRRPLPPAHPTPSMDEIIHRVPPPRFDEQSLAPGNDIPDFPSIYKASGVKDPGHGFTAFKVLEILSSSDFEALDMKAKAAAMSGFLRMNPAGPVPIEDVIHDALARDNALDGFEGFLRMKLDARNSDREKENASLQAGIDDLTRRNKEKIQANLDAAAEEQKRFAEWQARKRIEESKLFEAVGPFIEKNPVTVGNATGDKGPATIA
ncbi:MAG: hypothetical protein ABI672_07630 [Vicinamibacteria bacterium]